MDPSGIPSSVSLGSLGRALSTHSTSLVLLALPFRGPLGAQAEICSPFLAWGAQGCSAHGRV